MRSESRSAGTSPTTPANRSAVSKTVRSWSEAGHAQQYRGVVVFGDFLADQHVQVGQFLVQGDDVLCEGGDRDCGGCQIVCVAEM
jgi:hypothetical protein